MRAIAILVLLIACSSEAARAQDSWWVGAGVSGQHDGTWARADRLVPGVTVEAGAALGERWTFQLQADRQATDVHVDEGTTSGPWVGAFVPGAVVDEYRREEHRQIWMFTAMLGRHWTIGRFEPAWTFGGGVARSSNTLTTRDRYVSASGDIVRTVVTSPGWQPQNWPVFAIGAELPIRLTPHLRVAPYSTFSVRPPSTNFEGVGWLLRGGAVLRLGR